MLRAETTENLAETSRVAPFSSYVKDKNQKSDFSLKKKRKFSE